MRKRVWYLFRGDEGKREGEIKVGRAREREREMER